MTMRLRIVAYTKPRFPDLFPDRPTIHVAGETCAAGIGAPPRLVHGTVSMMIDGSVRWRLVRSTTLHVECSLTSLVGGYTGIMCGWQRR